MVLSRMSGRLTNLFCVRDDHKQQSVWTVISACVFAAMWYKRNSQPLKFRSINIMTILWLNMNLGMLYAAFSGSAGLTTQCDVQLLFQQIVVVRVDPPC